MTKILVLGSNSFGGSWFVDRALREGADVVGASRSPEPLDLFLPYRDNPAAGRFVFHRLDINHDIERLIELVDGMRPDYVVDFAAQSMVAQSWRWPEHWYQTNVVAKVRLHNALKDRPFVKRYVRVSTPEVYGDCANLIDESAPFNPTTPYAVSQAATDMSLSAFHRQYGFPVVVTRFANFYGPCQQLYRIVPKTILCALTGSTLPLHGGGHSVRAFIHGADVADGLYRAMMDGRDGETYHFSPSDFIEIRGLVAMIADRLGVPMERFVQVADDRPGKDQAYLMDSGKARRELGWEPRHSLEDGVAATAAWVRANLDVMATLPQDYIHKP